jgi:DNA-nicking Smr family endonuclease
MIARDPKEPPVSPVKCKGRRKQRFVPLDGFERRADDAETSGGGGDSGDDGVAFLCSLFPAFDRDLAHDVIRDAGSVVAAVEMLLSVESDDSFASPPPQQAVLSDAVQSVLEVLPELTVGADTVQAMIDAASGNVQAVVEELAASLDPVPDPGPDPDVSAPKANNSKAIERWRKFARSQRPAEWDEPPKPDAAQLAAMPMDLCSKIKLQSLRARYAFVEESLLVDVFALACNNETVAQTILADLFPDKIERPKRSPSPTPPPQQQPRSRSPTPTSKGSASPTMTPTRRTIAVTTSAEDLEKLRDKAEDEREHRNALYREAAAAFARGDGATAKALADKGRVHDRAMREMRSTFVAAANPGTGAIDLHGLTVEESIGVLEKELLQRAAGGGRRRRGKVLTIVTGRGQHSDGLPKLLPAVRDFLKRNHMTFSERSGMFIVRFSQPP